MSSVKCTPMPQSVRCGQPDLAAIRTATLLTSKLSISAHDMRRSFPISSFGSHYRLNACRKLIKLVQTIRADGILHCRIQVSLSRPHVLPIG